MPGVNKFPLKTIKKGFKHNAYPKYPVVYKLVNKNNGKFYIGQTINFRNRRKDHYYALIADRHCSPYLQKSFNKHGEDAYEFQILEEVVNGNVCIREQYYIETLKSYDPSIGYNILINTSTPHYGPMPLKTRLKISKAHIGKIISKETRKKQSEARKGRFVGKDHPLSKSVGKYDMKDNLIETFDAIAEAERSCGIQGIDRVLSGKRNSCGGFNWKYLNI